MQEKLDNESNDTLDQGQSSDFDASLDLVDPVSQPYISNQRSGDTYQVIRNLVETCNKFSMKKDNVAIFVTMKGTPCNEKSKLLAELGKIPKYQELTFVRTGTTDVGTKNLIALLIKETDKSLLDVVVSSVVIDLQSISVLRTNEIDNLPLSYIQQRLGELFNQESCIICIYKNLSEYLKRASEKT